MKVEFVNPFVAAAYQVLEAEVQAQITKGPLSVEDTHYTTNDITTIVGVVGRVTGTVLYGMSERTGRELAGAMLGRRLAIFDHLAESAVAELGNMITGRASAPLEQVGYRCTISPPALLIGRGTIISTRPFQRLVVTLTTQYGDVTIAVALRETASVPQGLQEVETTG